MVNHECGIERERCVAGIFTMALKEYVRPEWSEAPSAEASSPFFLEVVREGSIVATFPLTKEAHFVGRNADVCDIVAEHPSLSRQHAVFQFGRNNSLFVMDLGSAQGTKVNKKPIAPNEYVLLHVGDILSFAASTRLYIVNGPEKLRPQEYDSANVQAFRASLVQRSERAATQQQQQEEEKERASRNEGASWGFREDAVDENAGGDGDEDGDESANLPDYIKNDANYARKYGEKYSSSLRDSDVHEKDKAVLEKIRARERKIQNMQDENKKIYLKERSQDGGLTEGQEAAVARNDKRIEELKAEIEELEYSINLKNAQRSYASGGSGKNGRGDDNGGDDDALLDTTSATADATTNWRLRRRLGLVQGSGGAAGGATAALSSSSQAWTYQSLSEKKGAENEALEKTRKAIEDIEAVQSKLGDDDAIDGYLQAAHAAENQETLKKLRAEEASILAKLKEIDRLLKIATPALIGLVQPKPLKKEELSSPPSAKANPQNEAVPVLQSSSSSDTARLDKFIPEESQLKPLSAVPSSVKPSPQQPVQSSVENSSKRSAGDSAPQDFNEDTDEASKPPKKSARIVGPSRPPALSSPSSAMSFDGTKLQDGERVWVPPKNQSGDGRTALNDKFGY